MDYDATPGAISTAVRRTTRTYDITVPYVFAPRGTNRPFPYFEFNRVVFGEAEADAVSFSVAVKLGSVRQRQERVHLGFVYKRHEVEATRFNTDAYNCTGLGWCWIACYQTRGGEWGLMLPGVS